MILLSTSKCGEFCRNLTFRCAIRLRRHFHGSRGRILLRLFEEFVRWFGPVFACLGRVFQSFCFDDALQNKRTQSRRVATIRVQAQAIGPHAISKPNGIHHRRDEKAQHTKGDGRAWQSVHPINGSVKIRAWIAPHPRTQTPSVFRLTPCCCPLLKYRWA